MEGVVLEDVLIRFIDDDELRRKVKSEIAAHRHESLAQEIGMRIRLARDRKGLTQKDISQFFGVTIQAVSQWERGVHQPELVRAALLCKMLGVSLDWLCGVGAPSDDSKS